MKLRLIYTIILNISICVLSFCQSSVSINYDSLFFGQDLSNLYLDIRDEASKSDFFLRKFFNKLEKRGDEKRVDYIFDPLTFSGYYGLQYIIPVIIDNPDSKLNLFYHFDDSYSSLAPDSTIQEIKVQLAIKELYPNVFFDYLIERGNKLYLKNWKEIAAFLEMDIILIESYIANPRIKIMVYNNYLASEKIKQEKSERRIEWEGNKSVTKIGFGLMNAMRMYDEMRKQ